MNRAKLDRAREKTPLQITCGACKQTYPFGEYAAHTARCEAVAADRLRQAQAADVAYRRFQRRLAWLFWGAMAALAIGGVVMNWK